MPRKINRKAERIAVYLMPSIEQDATILAAWNAAKGVDRTQDVFRRALGLGLRAMFEAGELSDAFLNQGQPPLRERLARRGLPRAFEPPGGFPAPVVASPPAHVPETIHAPQPGPRPEPPPRPATPRPPAEPEEPDYEDLMALMGGSQPAVREDA